MASATSRPTAAAAINAAPRMGRAAVAVANALLDRCFEPRGVRVRLALRRRVWWGSYRSRCGRTLDREYHCLSLLPWLTLETWRAAGPPRRVTFW